MKKLLSILMSVLFIAVVIGPGLCLAIGEEADIQSENPMRYSLTSSITASLSISGGTAHVAGKVSAKYASAQCTVKVQLQKKINGTWYSWKTWNGSGTQNATAGGDVTVTPGSYRTCVLGTVNYNGSTEYPVKYSATKTY